MGLRIAGVALTSPLLAPSAPLGHGRRKTHSSETLLKKIAFFLKQTERKRRLSGWDGENRSKQQARKYENEQRLLKSRRTRARH